MAKARTTPRTRETASTLNYNSALELEGISAQQLLKLDGHSVQLYDRTVALRVSETSVNTYTITACRGGHVDELTVCLNPEDNLLYLQGDVIDPYVITCSDLGRAAQLVDRGIDPELPSFDESDAAAKEDAINAFDNVTAMVKRLVARAINEGGFGQNMDDTVEINVNDRDIEERSLYELGIIFGKKE